MVWERRGARSSLRICFRIACHPSPFESRIIKTCRSLFVQLRKPLDGRASAHVHAATVSHICLDHQKRRFRVRFASQKIPRDGMSRKRTAANLVAPTTSSITTKPCRVGEVRSIHDRAVAKVHSSTGCQGTDRKRWLENEPAVPFAVLQPALLRRIRRVDAQLGPAQSFLWLCSRIYTISLPMTLPRSERLLAVHVQPRALFRDGHTSPFQANPSPPPP